MPVTDVAEYKANSLNKALDALEAFTADSPQWGLSALSRELGIGKPTLHRLLRTLEGRGYLVQHPSTRQYRLGLKAWELGSTAVAVSTPTEAAHGHMRELSATTGEQVTLWVYDTGSVVCVHKQDGHNRVRTHTDLGAREPAWLMASGRCLLAHQPTEEAERVVAELPDDSPLDAADLRERLAEVRQRGYDVSYGDRWPDVCAVSAPVSPGGPHAVAAVTVSVVASRFTAALAQQSIDDVLAASKAISDELGPAHDS